MLFVHRNDCTSGPVWQWRAHWSMEHWRFKGFHRGTATRATGTNVDEELPTLGTLSATHHVIYPLDAYEGWDGAPVFTTRQHRRGHLKGGNVSLWSHRPNG